MQASLGQLVRDLRRAVGLTQEGLATRAGLSTRAISDLERGANHMPRPATLQLLISALGLSDRERDHFEAVARAHEGHSTISATSASQAAEELRGPWLPRGAATSIPLIGRARERVLLERHLAGEGPPLLLIAGEPGMGKTRLLQEGAALGPGHGLNVLRGTVSSPGDADTLDPIADALRNSLEGRSPVLLRRELQGCTSLVHVLPELGELDHAAPHSAREVHSPVTMTNAVLRFITNTAGRSGTLLTLDNLHDAAAPGLALLARLVRSSSNSSVRIIAAYRGGHTTTGNHPLSALLALLAHERLVRHMALPRLSTREAAELFNAVALQRDQTIDPWPARALRDSGGVPFYIVAWAEHLELLRQQHADTAVPWSIQQSVRFRMDAGPASVRPVLEVLAAFGGRTTLAFLTDLVALPPQEVHAALEWCVRERLVEEDDQAYAFPYGVIQTAVDADLSPSRRQLIRQRMAALGKRRNSAPGSATDDERAYHIAVLRRGRTAALDEPPLLDN